MKVLSINIGKEKTFQIGDKRMPTGIDKLPVDGEITLTETGFSGDDIVDTSVHGGKDQALYLYSQEDYDWWEQQLNRTLPPGSFGENVTLASFGDEPLKVGDRLCIGDAYLEVTAPRVPCVKFAHKMGDPGFVKTFAAAVRPGAYVRVLKLGQFKVGDSVLLERTTEDYITVNDVFIEWHKKDKSAAILQKALASPLAEIARRKIEGWL